MARTLNAAAHAARQDQILDAALRLFRSKGYDRMTIADLRREVAMSNGALFHYFASKQAVLDAVIERIRADTLEPLWRVARDPALGAVARLVAFFTTLDTMRMARKGRIRRLAQVWYSDGNAVVRQRVNAAVQAQRAPILQAIIDHGVAEGTMLPASGEVVVALLQALGDTLALALLAGDEPRVIAAHAAYMEALERILGLKASTLPRVSLESLRTFTQGAAS